MHTASLNSVYMQIQCWESALANVSEKSVGQVQIIDHSQVIFKSIIILRMANSQRIDFPLGNIEV